MASAYRMGMDTGELLHAVERKPLERLLRDLRHEVSCCIAIYS